MKKLFAAVLSFIKNNLITQDFKVNGFTYIVTIPFTKCDIYFKGVKPLVRYRGVEFRRKRDEFSLGTHGMTWAETQKPENAHLFVAKLCTIGA